MRLFLMTWLLLPAVVSCDHDTRAYKEGDVILGGLFNLHFARDEEKCGELYTVGLGMVEAMIFAIESVNQDPNFLPNVTIGYDIRNYCESSALAMRIAYDFVRGTDPVCTSSSKTNFDSSTFENTTNFGSKPISALVGPYNSGSAVLVGSLLQVAEIPAVSPSTTSPELSSQLYKDFFRTVPPDNWQAKVMADIIERFNWTYVAAVALDDSYGLNGIWALESESYDRKSFCIAFSEFIPRLGYQSKIKQTVSKIKMKPNIGVITVWLSGGYGRAFLKEAMDEKLQEKTLILSDALTAEEAVFMDPRYTILEGSLGIQPRDYPDSAFEEHVKKITPTNSIPDGAPWWKEFWESQFNCSASDPPHFDIAACDKNMSSYHSVNKIRSSWASYVVDAVYALAHALDSIYRCSKTDDAQTLSSCPSARPTVKARDVQKYLRNVSFNGLTGRVQFDSVGDPLSASYDIINFQRGPSTGQAHRKLIVGVWDKETTPKLQMNESTLRWSSSLHNMSTPVSFCSSECRPGTMKVPTTPCCWECKTCPQGTISTEFGSRACIQCKAETKPNERRTKCEQLPLINLTLTSASGISILVIVLIGCVLTFLVCVFYIKYYNTPIVKASSREVSFLLLFGIAALLALTVLELIETSDLFCCIKSIWRYSALSLCITVLYVKTMRITSVFKIDKVAQLFAPCFKSLTRQTLSIFVMNSVALALVALWMSVDPPRREKIIRSDEYIFLVCKPFHSITGFSFFIAVCGYTLSVALLCTYYAFKARGIPENFNEARYIGFSMYILLLSSLAYFPVVFHFESWYVTLVSCSTTLVTSLGFLSCMFGPKIYIHVFHPHKNTREWVRSQMWRLWSQDFPPEAVTTSVPMGRTNAALNASRPEGL